MTTVASRGAARQKRHDRIRLRVEGSGSRPRLAVFRSNIHIYAQVRHEVARELALRALDGDVLAVERHLDALRHGDWESSDA